MQQMYIISTYFVDMESVPSVHSISVDHDVEGLTVGRRATTTSMDTTQLLQNFYYWEYTCTCTMYCIFQ